MFCVNCGAGQQTGQFCSNCGQAVQAPPTPTPLATPPSQPTLPVTPPVASPPPFGHPQQVSPASTPLSPPPMAPPPPPMPGAVAYGEPAPSDNMGLKIGIMAGVGAAVILLVGGLLLLNNGGTPKPEIDMARPDSRLMNLSDFSFDMTFWDDRTPIEDRSYPVFGRGEECPADMSVARILERGQVVASRYFVAGETLIQYVNFEQSIVEFSNASSLETLIDTVRQGYTSGRCNFEGDSLRTRLYGLSDGPDSFEVIGENSIVFNKDTIYDSSVLEATVRGVSVWIVQDNYLIITEASLDVDARTGITFQQLFRSVEDAIEKAYRPTG